MEDPETIAGIAAQDVDFIQERLHVSAPTKRKRLKRFLSSSSDSSDCQEINKTVVGAGSSNQGHETIKQPVQSNEQKMKNSRIYLETDKLPVKMKSAGGGSTWFKFVHQQSSFSESERTKVSNFNALIRHLDAILPNDIVSDPRCTRS